ncbi:MAG TPA: Tn3 family transposase [Blastocatellia bacterium]|nr:Tn3 family transposase [Blastocatellia bacterium]
MQRHQTIKELVVGLEQSVLQTLETVERLVADTGLTEHEKLAAIESVLETQAPQRETVTAQVRQLGREADSAQHEADFFAQLSKRSLKLQTRVADIVRYTLFDFTSAPSALVDALIHFQQMDGEIDKTAPQLFLSDDECDALMDDGRFQVSLYKALLFAKVADAIKSGALNLVYSHRYRSLDDYLISPDDWTNHRTQYLSRSELNRFADCRQTLQDLSLLLDQQYHQTNDRIERGENAFIKFRPDGSFFVNTPKEEETDSTPLSTFFTERKYISLLEVLATVNQATGFLDEFEHWQRKYQKGRPPEKTFLAGIIGYGCDIGQKKIAFISKQIDESELETTINWYFSLFSIQAANDRIVSFLDQLDMPNLYRREPDRLHTSSDGQKFEVSVESLNAN